MALFWEEAGFDKANNGTKPHVVVVVVARKHETSDYEKLLFAGPPM